MPDPARNPEAGTPRWVLVSLAVAAVAILLLLAMVLSGRGGGHGPGRHTGLPSGVTHEP